MKTNKNRKQSSSKVVFVYIVIVLVLGGCSKQPEGNSNQAPTPEPKMEGQSANWKVTVTHIERVPKEPLRYDPMFDPVRPLEGPENKHDTVRVTVNVQYTGPAGDFPSPTVSLIDGQGQKLEGLKAALTEAPGERIPRPDDEGYAEKMKSFEETLSWIDPSGVRKLARRSLKGGEKFAAIYYFQDPKEFVNIKLVFNDVAPITLNAPKAETPSPTPQPETQPAQTAIPPADIKGEGQSKNWKVKVTTLEKVANDTTDSSNPRDSIEVRLELEYAGRPSMVRAPAASLTDGKGAKYPGDIRQTGVMEWIFPSGSPEVPLKPGAQVSVVFSFKDPKEHSNLKLSFEDVPPILLKGF